MRKYRKIEEKRESKKGKTKNQKIRTTIIISTELWEELKIKSIKERKTIGEIIEEMFKKQKQKQKRKISPKKEDIVII